MRLQHEQHLPLKGAFTRELANESQLDFIDLKELRNECLFGFARPLRAEAPPGSKGRARFQNVPEQDIALDREPAILAQGLIHLHFPRQIFVIGIRLIRIELEQQIAEVLQRRTTAEFAQTLGLRNADDGLGL